VKEKNIPLRNYFILFFVLLLSIILIIYFYMWYGTYEENRLNTPIMNKYLNVINYNELEDYLIENKDAIIYASILENEEVRVFEKNLKNVINEYSLNNSILYLDLTSEWNNNSISNDLYQKYSIDELPSILVFRNGVLYSVYNIKSNFYNIDNLVSYLTVEGVIND